MPARRQSDRERDFPFAQPAFSPGLGGTAPGPATSGRGARLCSARISGVHLTQKQPLRHTHLEKCSARYLGTS